MPSKTSNPLRAPRRRSGAVHLTGYLDADKYRSALDDLRLTPGRVRIIFRAPGGDVDCDEFYRLADAINRRAGSVVGIADTETVSAAACLFLQCGDRRVLPGTVIQVNGPYAKMSLASVIAGHRVGFAERQRLGALHRRFAAVLRRGLARTKGAGLANAIISGKVALFRSDTHAHVLDLEEAGVARLLMRRLP